MNLYRYTNFDPSYDRRQVTALPLANPSVPPDSPRMFPLTLMIEFCVYVWLSPFLHHVHGVSAHATEGNI